jgi:hypothetical protein
LLLLLLAVFELSPPGVTPNSASGSLASFVLAFAAFTLLSWLERFIAEAIRTMTNAAASPVSPMRIRCALLPTW